MQRFREHRRFVLAMILCVAAGTALGCSTFRSSRRLNLAIVAWSRAHQRMAAGITDPAQIDIFGIAKKAAGAASPLP